MLTKGLNCAYVGISSLNLFPSSVENNDVAGGVVDEGVTSILNTERVVEGRGEGTTPAAAAARWNALEERYPSTSVFMALLSSSRWTFIIFEGDSSGNGLKKAD